VDLGCDDRIVGLGVRVRIQVEGEDPETLRSLRGFLQDDPAVRRSGELGWAKAESSQQMGALVDVLSLIIGSGFSASQLIMTIVNWRMSRHPAPLVTISRELPDGRSIRIETSDPALLAQAVRELESS
jgi:Effector Associated Constant Component 1